MGLISGGCLEDEAARLARAALRDGEPILVTVDHSAEGDELWGSGLGCRGVIELLAEPPFMAADTLEALRSARDGTPSYLLTELGGDRRRLTEAEAVALGERASAAVAHGRPVLIGETVLDPILPPLHLVICGAGSGRRAPCRGRGTDGLARERRRSTAQPPAIRRLWRRGADRRRAGSGGRGGRRRSMDGGRPHEPRLPARHRVPRGLPRLVVSATSACWDRASAPTACSRSWDAS